jgi:hypothetical protein
MIRVKILFFSLLLLCTSAASSLAGMSTQVGGGYGKQFLSNKDLEQYEVFWRQPLPYKTILGDYWNVTTDLEVSAALLRESGSDNSETARFSLMPQVILSPHDMVNFIIGFGAGVMTGETEFTDHNLGGPFLLASKLGAQFLFGEHWGLECVYYHQSNAGIYRYNASLNMVQVAFAYNF